MSKINIDSIKLNNHRILENIKMNLTIEGLKPSVKAIGIVESFLRKAISSDQAIKEIKLFHKL
ncbi:MAG: hypothetical protein M0R46_11330 [Candidatus Muirbacterium halophilum]|nr:hypothetical protein [Candidatus Muirbacterium halophilum]MCK9476505.1 hypothetical protein [Candidatus Muirbacterium halophilum]